MCTQNLESKLRKSRRFNCNWEYGPDGTYCHGPPHPYRMVQCLQTLQLLGQLRDDFEHCQWTVLINWLLSHWCYQFVIYVVILEKTWPIDMTSLEQILGMCFIAVKCIWKYTLQNLGLKDTGSHVDLWRFGVCLFLNTNCCCLIFKMALSIDRW